jgi:beta-mannan synthase
MDLSLRVYLRGWRSTYLHDVCCPNELPSTLSAYKTQQFRWLSGPMQIVRKSFANIFFCR